MMMTLPIALARALHHAFGTEVVHARRIGGGNIHQTRQLRFASGQECFLKFQPDNEPDLLSAELHSLGQLAPHIRVPNILESGKSAGFHWLALEWMELRPHTPNSLNRLGSALATMHTVCQSKFGNDSTNFLGSTPQDNRWSENWCEFFLIRRIEPLLSALHDHGQSLPSTSVLSAVERCLTGHQPPASLLHGDLWTGNTAALPDHQPVVFDPACYFGDAETDLAMLELFGGTLPDSFLRAYADIRPLLPDREQRRPAYDLLHALNHWLIFGDAYHPMVDYCLRRLGI